MSSWSMLEEKPKDRKFVCLVSTGIDSPVSAYIMSRYGELILVHSYNYPFVDELDREVFLDLAKEIQRITRKVSRIYILPHGLALKEIKEKVRDRYRCVICKRIMLRYGKRIAKVEGADAVVTGDSLGQVASQTLENLFVEQANLRFPVIRPLIGLDKEEIIGIAKEIGTFSISTRFNLPCKAVSSRPSTRSDRDKVLEEERKIDVERLVERIMKEAEIIDL